MTRSARSARSVSAPSLHPVRATSIASLALLSATWSITAIVRPGFWLLNAFAVILAVGLVMIVSRRFRSWLPGPAGLVTVAFYANAACASGQSVLGVIPTPRSVAALVRDFGVAMAAMIEEAPLGPQPEIFRLPIILGLGFAAVAAVLVAADLGRPALAGLPIAAPWILSGVVVPDASLVPALFTGAAYLALLAWGGARKIEAPGIGWPGGLAAAVVAAGTAAGLLLVTVGPVLPGWGSQDRAWHEFLGRLGPGSGFDDGYGLSVVDSLRRDSESVYLRTTPLSSPGETSEASQRLRLDTYYAFDGRQWLSGSWSGFPVNSGGLLWPSEIRLLESVWSDQADAFLVEVVDPSGLGGRLPLALGPRWLSELGGAEYNPSTDSVRLSGNHVAGWSYQVVALTLDRAKLTGLAAGGSGATAVAWSSQKLPHKDEVAALAAAVTAGAGSDFAKMQAVEAYFHGSDFTYSLAADYSRSSDPVWDFLKEKTGFCVHYATAAALMARALGFPARVATGFIAGTLVDADGTREIRGADAHAWPEVYFEGAGWVAFEPTPNSGAGEAEADDSETSTPEPSASFSPSAEPTAEASPATVPTGVPAPGQTADRRTFPWPYALGFAGAAAVGVGVWFLRRRRRARATAERIWQVFQAKALRRGWLRPGQSVRSAAAALGGRLGDPAAQAALFELARLVETQRYARPADAAGQGLDAAARRCRDLVERSRLFSRRRPD
ncbi:MAG: DUF3488 and transglutaminase-like domain-containing protein [Propionibacteriaceae bacterium]|jgi:hypothetical protein|nr:DUF3488 and transglutaminase-like domain-containing protein [Propionibacteriaceae bacterium]